MAYHIFVSFPSIRPLIVVMSDLAALRISAIRTANFTTGC
jgi:hypothetical protein